MSAIQISYKKARKLMQPGDIIAFGGKSPISEVVKFLNYAAVSHIGTVVQTKIVDDDSGRFFNQVIESTSAKGVAPARLSELVHDYEGEIWFLPLSENIRKHKFNQKQFFDFLFTQVDNRKEYDVFQTISAGIDTFDDFSFFGEGLSYGKEDFSKFFCSELVSAAYEHSGVIDEINSSEVTPIDICRWSIYEEKYYQIKGEEKDITRFNTANPNDWKA